VTQAETDTPWWLSDTHPKPPVQTSQSVQTSQTEKPREPKPPAPNKADLHAHLIPVQSWDQASAWVDDFTPLHHAKATSTVAEETAPMVAQNAPPRVAEKVIPLAFAEAAPIAAAEIAPKAVEKPVPVAFPEVAPVAAAPVVAEEVAPSVAEEAAPVTVQDREHETAVVPSASRLNPLRGLMFSLGLKNLERMKHGAPAAEKPPAAVERESDRAIIERNLPQFAEPVPVTAPPPVEAKMVTEAASQVTAQPEILSPKEFIPIRDTANASETASFSQYDRGDEFELRILPSKRGQYKRRG
jgi:hypothetical protein